MLDKIAEARIDSGPPLKELRENLRSLQTKANHSIIRRRLATSSITDQYFTVGLTASMAG
jgi:hypothetical protein